MQDEPKPVELRGEAGFIAVLEGGRLKALRSVATLVLVGLPSPDQVQGGAASVTWFGTSLPIAWKHLTLDDWLQAIADAARPVPPRRRQ